MARMEEESGAVFNRRAAVLGLVSAGVYAGLAARVYPLQILQQDKYAVLADDNRFNYHVVAPERGRILDRFGAIIAGNRENYRILVTPEDTGGLEALLERLSAFFPLDDDARAVILRQAKNQPGFVPLTVAENLDWSAFAAVNLRAPELPGVTPDVGLIRAYPDGEAFAHLVGYVGKPSEDDVARDPNLRHPGFRVGRQGLERSHDENLRGEAGSLKVEVNAYGRVIRERPEEGRRAKPGQDLVLSVDAELQRYAVERLGEESGSAVVMAVETGEILALASAPAFDSNVFARIPTPKEFAELRGDPRRPLFNKAVQGVYPPASTYKMVMAHAILHHGVADPEERVFCGGRLRLGSRVFHCWRRGGHGGVDLNGAIKGSCDVYFYEMARRLGMERITPVAQSFGIGERLDLGLNNETAGLLPDPQWKRARFDQPWVTGDTFNHGIGQGFLGASPLQLAVMTARLASGRAIQPTLTLPPKDDAPPLPYDAEAFARVRAAMGAVCEEPGGTAFGKFRTFGEADLRAGGKTGTAQVRSITQAERRSGVLSQSQLRWELRNHALFVAFAPLDAPKYAISVVIDHGGSGSGAAAPVARDILLRAVQSDPLGRPRRYAQADGTGP
ncbi:MAG: penicillin-binding protein 2 [Maricaulaceae bacterium]